jgi:probable phosphoglycerate mutase
MGDLHCAARVFVARHGEADYESELLSDAGGSLSALGREQALALADSLTGQRIAHVYVSSMSRAVQTGEIVAARLGVGVTVRHGLREFSGESGSQVVDRVCGVLEEAADRCRGEAVLVVSHGGAICTAIPNLARNVERRFPLSRPLANCDVIELAADADGWVARSWAGVEMPT